MKSLVKTSVLVISASLVLAGCMAHPDNDLSEETPEVAAQAQKSAGPTIGTEGAGGTNIETGVGAPSGSLMPPAEALPSMGGCMPPTATSPSFGAPNYPAPTYQSPSFQAPLIQGPHYGAPNYEQQLQAPGAEVPSYLAPAYSAPSFAAPTYQAPTYQGPTFLAPIIQAPTYEQQTCAAPVVPAAPVALPSYGYGGGRFHVGAPQVASPKAAQ